MVATTSCNLSTTVTFLPVTTINGLGLQKCPSRNSSVKKRKSALTVVTGQLIMHRNRENVCNSCGYVILAL